MASREGRGKGKVGKVGKGGKGKKGRGRKRKERKGEKAGNGCFMAVGDGRPWLSAVGDACLALVLCRVLELLE